MSRTFTLKLNVDDIEISARGIHIKFSFFTFAASKDSSFEEDCHSYLHSTHQIGQPGLLDIKVRYSMEP